VAVIAENGGGGSSTAAPMARKVMDAWLLNKYDALPEPLPAPDAAPHESE
jgi:penicillin-binding protein 2